jgi:hypothetical protein
MPVKNNSTYSSCYKKISTISSYIPGHAMHCFDPPPAVRRTMPVRIVSPGGNCRWHPGPVLHSALSFRAETDHA